MKQVQRKYEYGPDLREADFTRPFVIPKAVNAWNAFQTWDETNLKGRFGEVLVNVDILEENIYHPTASRVQRRVEMEFQTFLERLSAGESLSFSEQTLVSHQKDGEKRGPLACLVKELPTLPFIPGSWRLYSTNLWLSSSGPITVLHFDLFENFYSLFSGEKRFIIFPPKCAKELDPAPVISNHYWMSQSVLTQERLDRLPKWVIDESCEATLSAGDLLFIPPFWWHQVESYGWSLAVNHFFQCPYKVHMGLYRDSSRLYYLKLHAFHYVWRRMFGTKLFEAQS